MSRKGAPSEYLRSSVISYFGESKGKELLELLRRSGITCFDDLAKGVPEGLADLADISLEQINKFLEEYGPQAIPRLKNMIIKAEKRIKELEIQVEWAKKQLLSRKENSMTYGKGKAIGTIRSCLIKLNMLTEVIELNYDEDKPILEAGPLKEELLAISSDLLKASRDPSIQETAEDLKSIANALSGLVRVLDEVPRSGDVRYAVMMAASALSDIMLSLTRGSKGECLQVLMENVSLKAEVLSQKVSMLRGRVTRPTL